MRKRRNFRDTHHIISRAVGGSNAQENLVVLDRTTHERLHLLFKNMMPHEQMIYLLKINESAMKRDVVIELYTLLNNPETALYKKEVFD